MKVLVSKSGSVSPTVLKVIWAISNFINTHKQRDALDRLMPKGLPTYSIPTHEEDVLDETKAVDFRRSSVTYDLQRAKGWKEFATSFTRIPGLADVAGPSAGKAMLEFSKALEECAAANTKRIEQCLSQASTLLSKVNLSTYLKLDERKKIEGVGVEGCMTASVKSEPSMRCRIMFGRELDKNGYAIKTSERMLRISVFGPIKAMSKKLDVPIGTDPDEVAAQFKQLFISLAPGKKQMGDQLKTLKANDRRLKPGELQMMAALFTVSNTGQGGHEFTKGKLVSTVGHRPSASYSINSDAECAKAGRMVLNDLANLFEGEADPDDEYRSWLKDLKSMTLVKLATTWKDQLDLCSHLASL